MNHEVISAFADCCGYRDLDPVEVLKFLNAQDWLSADEGVAGMPEVVPSLKIHEDPDEASQR